ncbi:hypothetical protein ACIBG0_36790 [Nocardia sp. NPDC050630]|uniref:hypothetical protein n=1 Tax=Nocardia sp. NPDC050630 TaxID=3364321 RepID=UPI003793C948
MRIAIDQYQRLLAEFADLTSEFHAQLQLDLDGAWARLVELVATVPEQRDAVDAVIAEIIDAPDTEHDPLYRWPSVADIAARTRAVIDSHGDPDITPPTLDDLARLYQLTWVVRDETAPQDQDALFQLIVAQQQHIQRFLASQPTMAGHEKYGLLQQIDRLRTDADAVLPQRLSNFEDWRYGLDPFDLTGIQMPGDVSVHDSTDPNTRYFVYAGRAVTVAIEGCAYEVRGNPRWAYPTAPTFADAAQIALGRIAEWRAAGLGLQHRRDGLYRAETYNRGWQGVDRIDGDLRITHELYRAAVDRLDNLSHIVARCGLDVDTLLSPAAHADTSIGMRARIDSIATTLRARADTFDSIVAARAGAAVGDDQMAHRRSSNLTRDARRLRRLATRISKGPQRVEPGDFIITFRNAINNYGRETAIRRDLESAMEHARNHHPFNNTRVYVEKVLSVHYDGPRIETVHISPTRTPPKSIRPRRTPPRLTDASSRAARNVLPPQPRVRKPRL